MVNCGARILTNTKFWILDSSTATVYGDGFSLGFLFFDVLLSLLSQLVEPRISNAARFDTSHKLKKIQFVIRIRNKI